MPKKRCKYYIEKLKHGRELIEPEIRRLPDAYDSLKAAEDGFREMGPDFTGDIISVHGRYHNEPVNKSVLRRTDPQ